jgi:ferredoxin-NADP reductase
MLDHALRSPRPYRIALIYSARSGDEFAFIDEFRAHERAGRLQLHQTVTRDQGGAWAGERGRIGRAHFAAALPEPTATLSFVCGPPPFVSEASATLGELGVPAALIRTERWGR